MKRIFLNCIENFENKDDKWCILTVFEAIFGNLEKILKAMNLHGAF